MARVDYMSQGCETRTQLLAAQAQAERAGRELTLLCTPIHFYHVEYFCQKDGIPGEIVASPPCIPRRNEAMRDMLLIHLRPWIDRLGLWNLYYWYVHQRRDSGKL